MLSPSRSFSAWPEAATAQQGWRGAKRALLPRRLEVSEELLQTQSWESTPPQHTHNKSWPPSSTTGSQWHQMLHNIVLLQPQGLCSPLSCAEQLSARDLFYHYFRCFIPFLGIQISVTALDALGEKWCPPPQPLQPNELPFPQIKE